MSIQQLKFSEQSALFAKISNQTYAPPKRGQMLFGTGNIRFDTTFISAAGSNVYVLSNETDVIVACRGTEVKEWSDVSADASIDRVSSSTEPGLIHRGFKKYTDMVWQDVKNAVLDVYTTNKQLWITGHSLGGAMATIMAYRFGANSIFPKPTALFTYGSPRVGNRDFIKQFNEVITHHRWVNDGDIVTKVSFSPWYYHCGTMHHIDHKGNITVNYDRKFSLGRVINFISPTSWLKLVFSDVQDHSSVNYVKQLAYWSLNDIS